MKRLSNIWGIALAAALLSACAGGGELPPTAFPGLIVDGPSAYLTSNLHAYKFDAASGAEAWRFPKAGETATAETPLPGPFAGDPEPVGNVIVVGQSTAHASGGQIINGLLFGIGEADGLEKWRFTKAGREYVDGVTTDGKLIYAPNGDHKLYALDPSQLEGGQPKILWQFETGNKLWGKPLLADGVLYQPSLDHRLYAIDAQSGKASWAQPFQASASIAATPLLTNGVLYFGSFDSKFYAVNARDGSKKWETPVEGWIWSEALIVGDTIYVGNVNGKFFALALGNGAVKWTADVGDTIRAKPVLQGNKLYVVSMNTHVYEFDISAPPSDGKMDTSKPFNDKLGRRMLSTPTIVNGQLYVPLFDGDIKVAGVSLKSKEKAFQFPPPAPATATP